MSTQEQLMRYARGGRRRKGAVTVDLNAPPPVESQEQVGGEAVPAVLPAEDHHPAIPVAQGAQGDHPAVSVALGAQGDQPAVTVAQGEHGHHPEVPAPPAPIDLEELDDDVVISSPRAFQEAKSKSRRIRRTVVDVESAESSGRLGLNQGNKRRRASSNLPVINCEAYVNLEGSSGYVRSPPPPPPPPPPPEPTFSCPVCMGALVEEVTTKCGHIFCKACIKAAISAQSKCPTCRRKVTNRDIIRVYLPTTK